ncbi:MAG: hypothetical protein QME62_09365 [Armatimonadota bacterium]|nr:hypothetical protein [Armatimonadota bacterium]
MNLSFCSSTKNDLYSILCDCGYRCPIFNTALDAVSHAKPGSGVLILADNYPHKTTYIEPAVFNIASEKRLKLYIEYPETLPDINLAEPRKAVWERIVVASNAFGKSLPLLQILSPHECTYIPCKAENPLLVLARVAGYDKAIFGLPEETYPILFEKNNLLIATTKLSNFTTGRYAPTKAWKAVWEHILAILDPENHPCIEWTPIAQPMFGPNQPLPKDFELQAFKKAVGYYHRSKLLIHKSEEGEIHRLLRAGIETRPTPTPDSPEGDGSHGILEGYASTIRHDGSQVKRIPIRSDCNSEAAMVLALGWAVNGDTKSRNIAKNLLDYVYFTSGMHGRERGNPEHPAFGLIAWGNIAPAWEVANYSDDNARVALSTMVAAACLDTDRWDENLLRILLANLRTTGTLGFRGDRIDMPQIEARGWKAYYDSPTINYSPHHESYLWACNLWAFKQTGYKPFLERTKTAIRMTMEAYPDGWRWKDSIERSRMLLCLAWLVRLEDTPLHRQWLFRIADDLIARQDKSGAIQELFGGGPMGFNAPKSNEAYGTTETPLIQENGDPASDQLYTTGFALLGFHEAYAATGDKRLKQAEDRLTEYLCRIQVKAPKIPYLDGAWFRAFDYRKWDYWSASGDIGWGAWCIESGWGQAWITAVLGLRQKSTSIWELTSNSRIIEKFHAVREQMAINKGEPFIKAGNR